MTADAALAPAKLPLLHAMTARLAHGGPDGEGHCTCGRALLGHRRLAIIDPAARADQPFRAGGDALVYNGELYNYRALRTELRGLGHTFVTTSDTEVMLRVLQQWGPAGLARCNGMFALAYWRGATATLLLARDPAGMKPLYYGRAGTDLVFASELKALRLHPDLPRAIDRAAVAHFLRRGYVGVTASVLAGVRQVPAGTTLTFTPTDPDPAPQPFYRLPADPGGAAADFSLVFDAAVRRHLLADVPVGVLLSGGVDSALVAATARRLTDAPLRTYTLGFADARFDEAPAAAAVARHLGTRHTGFRVDHADLRRSLDHLTETYDEPFGDASALATLLLAERVGQDVKCVLAGDGGDEVYGGYARYRATRWFGRYGRWVPQALADTLGRDPRRAARWLRALGRGGKHTEDRLYKLGHAAGATDASGFFARAADYTDARTLARLGVTATAPPPTWPPAVADLTDYLPGDLMTKTDRAAMRYGLEVRFPFLDRAVVRHGLSLPDAEKMDGRRGKLPLRAALARELPAGLIDPGKAGFAVPLDDWLRTDLRDEVGGVGDDPAFAARFGLDPTGLRSVVTDYLTGGRYVNAYPVWFLLVLHRWHRYWPA